MTTQIPILTIDGPSGAGKGTVSKVVANKLGWHYLDSGAIYRALAIALLQKHTSLDQLDEVLAVASSMNLTFQCGNTFSVLLNDVDVTSMLGTETTGNVASKVAAIPEVRQLLFQKQREFKQFPGLVADGRDMGTVVFPEAQVKVFLTASPAERAQRRYKQLKEKGIDVNIQQITSEIEERDSRDKGRAVAPLLPAVDAILIDSSNMSLESVIAEVLRLFPH